MLGSKELADEKEFSLGAYGVQRSRVRIGARRRRSREIDGARTRMRGGVGRRK